MLPSFARLALRQADTNIVFNYVNDELLRADAHARGVEQVHGTECPICLGEFEADDEVVVFSCGHVAHLRCAKDYYGRGVPMKCLVCRQRLVRADRREVRPQSLRLQRRFRRAIRNHDEARVHELVEQGADPNLPDENGMYLLIMATNRNDLDEMRLLLDIPDIDVNVSHGMGTVLGIACLNGNTEAVRLLLAAPGIRVDQPDEHGFTPLEWALMSRSEAIIKLLIDAGADVNAVDEDGDTALIDAARNGEVAIARLLLAAPLMNVNATFNGSMVLERVLLWMEDDDRDTHDRNVFDDGVERGKIDDDVDFDTWHAALNARRLEIVDLIRAATLV